jgi:HAD superfamily hydrolase (TIGR01509 family)
MTIRGIVFDFDGIIVDTEEPEFSTWVEIYHQYGAEITFKEWSACLGTTQAAFDAVAELEKKTGQRFSDPAEIWRRQAQMSLDRAMRQPPLPGVLDVLNRADQLGIKLAIASSSERDWVLGHLERLNLKQRFLGIYTKNEITPVKPDPGLYHAAIKYLDLRPEETIAFEDSPNGILAAKAAGMICVAIPNHLSGSLDLSKADFMVSSLSTQPLDDILSRANQILANIHQSAGKI